MLEAAVLFFWPFLLAAAGLGFFLGMNSGASFGAVTGAAGPSSP